MMHGQTKIKLKTKLQFIFSLHNIIKKNIK